MIADTIPSPSGAAERRLPGDEPAASVPLRVHLLGPMQAEGAAGVLDLPRVRKTRAIFAVLAMAAPKSVQREELAGLLWSTRGRPQARASLRQSVHELQATLGARGDELLQVSRDHLALRGEAIWTDVQELESGAAPEPLLARGAFLPDLDGLDPAFDAWIERQRRRIASLARAAWADRTDPAVSDAAANPALAVPPASEDNAPLRIGLAKLRAAAGEEAAFAIGLADGITTALSQFRGISCVAGATPERLSALTLDGLLEASVERLDGSIRIEARLLDMREAEDVVWQRRFERVASDPFALQDEIAAEIAAQIVPALLLRQSRRARAAPEASPDAHALTLRAIPAVYRLDPAGYREAGVLLQRAIALDPSYPAAHAWLAYWHLFLVGQGWTEQGSTSIMLAESLAERAVVLDPNDARALTLAGHVRAFLHRRVDEAIALHERALSLNPNLTWAWVFSSLAHTYAGMAEEGLRRALHAKRLDPNDPHGFMTDAARLLALLTLHRLEDAAALGRKAVKVAPHFSANLKIFAAALGHLGPDAGAEARQVIADLLRLEPAFTLRDAAARVPLLKPADLAFYVEGLRRAGLPE